MEQEGAGQVITFYSFKGGTGRTMALANVAWILAASGHKVLAADWDLESPGLHRFFAPYIDPAIIRGSGGIIDLIRDYEAQKMRNSDRPPDWISEFANVAKYAFSLRWTFPNGGRLDFLPAGRQNADYGVTVGALDWENFYTRLGGDGFFEALRADMKAKYDYALIDSRTGLSDVADICTMHLPDTVVACFTLSEQGIDGAAQVARKIRDTYRRRSIRVLPVPMRIDAAEKRRAEAGLAVAMRRFDGLPADVTTAERRSYWARAEVPYQAYYAYEEILAVFGDRAGSSNTVLSAYETLTSHLTHGAVDRLPEMEEGVRNRERARYERRSDNQDTEIVLRYAPKDALWFEWFESLFATVAIRAVDARQFGDHTRSGEQTPTLSATIVSPAYQEAAAAGLIPYESGLAAKSLTIYVADMKPLLEFPLDSSVFLTNLSEAAAAERVLRLIGAPGSAVDNEQLGLGTRYPGKEPQFFKALARNPRFTGREDQISHLREQLRSHHSAVVLPVALHGLGGIGKTQTALEYVHRYKSAYDVVCWIQADPVQFVDTSLIDLATQLGIPGGAATGDNARTVVQALSRGEPSDRWLLVFDNAENVEAIEKLLPQGRGHLLVTSRNRAWDQRGHTIPVDVFQRAESVGHLRSRVETMSAHQADRIADLLGDLPIAVAAAGALLAGGGTTVSDYLSVIETGEAQTQYVEKVWDISLAQLEKQSPAAYRMFQLCSQMAAEISLEVLSSNAMAELLIPLDSKLTDRLARGTLIQDINRLALLKLDAQAGQIHVHRLVSAVVAQRMTEEEREQTRHDVHLVLAACRPVGDADNSANWPRFRILWPHLTVARASTCDDVEVRQLLIDRVRYLWAVGDLQHGEELGQELSERWGQLVDTDPGPAGEDTLRRQLLQLRFNLANILRSQAHFDDARELDEAVLEAQTRLLGPRDGHTLMTAGSLAADLRGQGQYAEALKRDLATYATWFDVFGEDHPRSLAAANNLGVSYRLVGDFRAAREIDDRVYDRRRVVLGETNEVTLRSAACLGRDHRDAGDYARSVALLRRAYATICDERGRETIEAVLAQVNLAVSLRAAGEPEEAINILEPMYEWLVERLGPTNPETLACRLSRASTLLALNRLEAAQADMRGVEQSFRGSLGGDHPHTLVCVNNLAAIARGLEDNREARRLASTAADRLARTLGEDHPFAMAAQTNLAVCLAELGDHARAANLTVSVLARMTAKLGADHPDTLRCKANQAIASRRSEPSDEELHVVERLAQLIGDNHPSVQALRSGRYVHRVIDPHPF